MSDAQEKSSGTYDPFESFRAMRDAYLDAMAKATVEAVNTEAYAQATGAMLEGYLRAVAPLREALDKSMLQALQQMELPSRQELATLAERFTNVEMRLDDIDAKLDVIRKCLEQNGSGPDSASAEQAHAPAKAEPSRGTKAGANPRAARRPFVRARVRRTPR